MNNPRYFYLLKWKGTKKAALLKATFTRYGPCVNDLVQVSLIFGFSFGRLALRIFLTFLRILNI